MRKAQLTDRALRLLTKALQLAAGIILLGILFSGLFSPEIQVSEKGVHYKFPDNTSR